MWTDVCHYSYDVKIALPYLDTTHNKKVTVAQFSLIHYHYRDGYVYGDNDDYVVKCRDNLFKIWFFFSDFFFEI